MVAYSPELKFNKEHIKTYQIYVLKDPSTLEVFYVGRTERALEVRLAGHLSESEEAPNQQKRNRIREILAKGARPLIEQIEIIHGTIYADKIYAAHREANWIWHYKDAGNTLLNSFIPSKKVKSEYTTYLEHKQVGQFVYRYYHCGKTFCGHDVYDIERIKADGFQVYTKNVPEPIDLLEMLKRSEDRVREIEDELKEDFRKAGWPPPWIDLDLLKNFLPPLSWTPEFAAEIPPDEFLLDLQLDDELEQDDWGEEDDFAEMDDYY